MEQPVAGDTGPSFVEQMKHNLWESIGAASLGMFGMLAYMALHMFQTNTKKSRKRRIRDAASKAYHRRVTGPWRNSQDHVTECHRRLTILMRRTKRTDRKAYVLYRDMKVTSKAGDQDGYTKAVDAYKAYLEECKRARGV